MPISLYSANFNSYNQHFWQHKKVCQPQQANTLNYSILFNIISLHKLFS